MSLRQAAGKVRKAIMDEGPEPYYHKRMVNQLLNDWPTLYNAVEDLMDAYEQGDESERPPKDQWNLLLEYDWKADCYDVFLCKVDTKNHHTIAFKGNDMYEVVPEGAELPQWTRISAKALEEGSIFDAFKNVYVRETVWRKQ